MKQNSKKICYNELTCGRDTLERVIRMKKMNRVIIGLLLIQFSAMLIACEGQTSRPSSELKTPFTDAITLDLDYEGLSFVEDGLGAVQLHRCVDGDTARFTEDGGLTHYSVRFLGIDTPEVGRNAEPWGAAASRYVCDRLNAAETIVLEWDASTTRLGTYGRYLAFVWVDGRLLNLELIELAFTESMGIRTRFGEEMTLAWFATRETGRRIYGERDPDYPYTD
ncbi:MAG: hypothetical protein EA374_00950 [Acholeplasmatales bacterium]|nr:MAG: hypothetical protein EA374_00950 [Acholeplasmatales bacterium]